MTLEEASKEVNFTVLVPSYLPEGFTFNSSIMSKFENIETVSLEYKKGSQILSLSETLQDESNPSPDMGAESRRSALMVRKGK